MNNYSLEKLQVIESYIENYINDLEDEILENRSDIVMTIDWREDDREIIQCCENNLKTGILSSKLEESNNMQGFTISISYADKSFIIPYQGTGADRNTTLLSLNEIIQPDYEIRFCNHSDGQDTLQFIPLPKEIWDQLDLKYPIIIEIFEKFNKDSIFF